MLATNHYLIALTRNDDEKRLLSRMDELLQKALQGRTVCSDFLDLRQLELTRAVMAQGNSIGWRFDGGYEFSERQRLVVYPDWEPEGLASIACLKITPQSIGPIDLGHRDYLGAILNLGISRAKLGDIVLQNDCAFVFVDQNLADYICQQLSRVKHSSVSLEVIQPEDFVYQPAQPVIRKVTLASLRLDAAIAAAYDISRSEAVDLIEKQQVKINQMQLDKSAVALEQGDLVSVRGRGRFRIEAIGGQSRKGRYQVEISRW